MPYDVNRLRDLVGHMFQELEQFDETVIIALVYPLSALIEALGEGFKEIAQQKKTMIRLKKDLSAQAAAMMNTLTKLNTSIVKVAEFNLEPDSEKKRQRAKRLREWAQEQLGDDSPRANIMREIKEGYEALQTFEAQEMVETEEAEG